MQRLAAVTALMISAALSAPANAGATDMSTDAHIAQIEHGLVPPIVVADRPRQSSSLVERMRETHTPGVSIAFFENGRIVWARAYGLADVASARPVTPDTRFQAGSISKPVTAVAALNLVQAGVLDLDQDVNQRLTGWRVPDTAFTAEQKVTLRRLLSHTAGLTVHGYDGYPVGGPVPSTIQVLNGAPPANSAPVVSASTPGQYWAYSGGGYVLTQLLMSEATGEPFPAVMRREVLEPAHMSLSTYDQPPPDALTPSLATGYRPNGDPVVGNHHIYPEMAAAGLWTTPSDLARFAIAVQASVEDAPHALLGPAMAKAMTTRTLNNWGLGVDLGPPDGPAMFQHSGDDQGFNADLIAFTSGSRQGVAIMTNSDSGSTLIPEIVRAVAESYGWEIDKAQLVHLARLTPDALARLAGVYEIAGLATLTITVTPDGLRLDAPAVSPQPYALLPASETHFFVLENGVTLDFQRGADGVVDAIAISGPLGNWQARRKR
jgi:CubicO group peptidase (beta-lactamase class C family)